MNFPTFVPCIIMAEPRKSPRTWSWRWIIPFVAYICLPARRPTSVLLSASPTEVRLLAALPTQSCAGVQVVLRHAGIALPAVTAETVGSPLESSGLHALARITGLQAATEYGYEVRCQGDAVASGSIRTPPAPGRALVRFGFGSCILPTALVPLVPFDGSEALGRLDFFLSLGDTIYGDLYSSLPSAYDALWRAASFRTFAARTPLLSAFDDHETGYNDPEDAAGEPGFERGMSYWWLRLGSANPGRGAASLAAAPSGTRARRWFSFRSGGVDLFVADTVTHRASHPAGRWSPLGREQALELRRWLGRPAPLKVVATSIPFAMGSGLPLSSRLLPWQQNHSNYYRESALHAWLLGALRSRRRRNVLLLSGDVHGARAYSLAGGRAHEVMCAPLHNLATETVATDEVFPRAERTSKIWEDGAGWQHVGTAEVDTRVRGNASLTVSVWRYGIFWPRTPQLAYRLRLRLPDVSSRGPEL